MIGADASLALAYVPAANRDALAALFEINAAMADVVRTTSEPMIGRIRLAWWREQLEALDTGGEAPAEPRLRKARALLLPRGISGADLAGLETGWAQLFDPFPWTVDTAEATWLRGLRLFGMGARLLGHPHERVQQAGGLWTLVDAARHCSDASSRAMLVERARTMSRSLKGTRVPAPLRPLTMLAALAIRDLSKGEPFEADGTPARAWTMFRHRVSGAWRAP